MNSSSFVALIGFLVAFVSKVESIGWRSDGNVMWSDNCGIPGEENAHTQNRNYEVCKQFCIKLGDCTHFTIDYHTKKCTSYKGWKGDPYETGNSLCGWLQGKFQYGGPPATNPPTQPPTTRATDPPTTTMRSTTLKSTTQSTTLKKTTQSTTLKKTTQSTSTTVKPTTPTSPACATRFVPAQSKLNNLPFRPKNNSFFLSL